MTIDRRRLITTTGAVALASALGLGTTRQAAAAQKLTGVTYLPDREELLVAASGLTADGVHDHELWLVPAEAGAELRSLGLIAPGEERRVPVDPALAAMIDDGSQMVLTREPLGGKPPNEAAGPVVAEGAFGEI